MEQLSPPIAAQHASGLLAASATLAATAVALPACGFRAPALLRTLRCSAALRAAGKDAASGASLAGPCLPPSAGAAGAWPLAGRWLTGQAAHAPSLSPSAAAANGALRQPQLPSLVRRFCTAPAAAASSRVAAEAAVGSVAGRCGLQAGSSGLGGSQQLRLRALGGARRMATQAQQGASGPTAAAAPAVRPRGLSGRLSEAARLQLAAGWQTYGPAVYVAGAIASVYLLWRFMYSVTGAYISVNEKMAEYGLMGLAAAVVLVAALYVRWRLAVNPAAVYRQAIVKLNTHPGVLEVMGAPLVGSEVRAYVVTGGGVYLSKKLRIKLRSRRIQMMFPLSGGERKGLVSLEAKRKKGKYAWKLLAVDLGPELQAALPASGATGLSAAPPPKAPADGSLAPPAASRVYVIGDAAAYTRGGVLRELRAPFLQALSNSRSYEVEDELEDELDELALPEERGGAIMGAVQAAGSAVQRAVQSAAVLLSKPPAAAEAAKEAEGKEAAEDAGAAAAARQAQVVAAPPPQPAAAGSASWFGRMRTALSGPAQPGSGDAK